MGLSLIGRNQQGRKEKLSFPLNPGQSSLSLLLLVEAGVALSPMAENKKKKKKKKRLFLSALILVEAKIKRSNQGKPFTSKRESCK